MVLILSLLAAYTVVHVPNKYLLTKYWYCLTAYENVTEDISVRIVCGYLSSWYACIMLIHWFHMCRKEPGPTRRGTFPQWPAPLTTLYYPHPLFQSYTSATLLESFESCAQDITLPRVNDLWQNNAMYDSFLKQIPGKNIKSVEQWYFFLKDIHKLSSITICQKGAN